MQHGAQSVYLPENPRHTASVTLDKKERIGRSMTSVSWTIVWGSNPITDCHEKIRARVITPVAKKACELRNHFSSHHRANGKGVPVPVGHIS